MLKPIVVKNYNSTTGVISFIPTGKIYDTISGAVSDSGISYPTLTSLDESLFELVGESATPNVTNYGWCNSLVIDPTGSDVNIKIDNVVVGSVAAPTNTKVQAKLNELLEARSLVDGCGMCTVDTVSGSDSRINFVLSAQVDINVGGSAAVYK